MPDALQTGSYLPIQLKGSPYCLVLEVRAHSADRFQHAEHGRKGSMLKAIGAAEQKGLACETTYR